MDRLPFGLPSAGPRPAFAAVAATLGVITLTLLASALAGRPVAGGAALHGALLVAFVAAVAATGRIPAGGWRDAAQGLLVIGVMFFLYGSLGQLAFDAIPWTGDGWLRSADRLLGLGREPVLWVAGRVDAAPAVVEPLAFVYGAFIPYLYLSIFLGLIGRPPAQRAEFITAFAILYGLSFVGYLFVPAYGPVVAMADAFDRPLAGGALHDLVVRSIDGMGGPHGAFPSLHVGASVMACAFDLRGGDRLRGLIYVPLVALIAVATVALRYHYVVDLLAGAALAATALAAARRLAGGPVPAGARADAATRRERGRVTYRVVRLVLRVALLGFFRRTAVEGRHRIPGRGPVLLVSNHVNAFVDPLIVLTRVRRRVTLTAKRTLAGNPLLAPLIRALGVILLSRRSDAGDDADPERNRAALEACVRRLEAGGALYLFPEGVSHSDPGMRPWRTGGARIVLDFLGPEPEAEVPAAARRDLTIVPIGLHYDRKSAWRSDAVALVGEPVSGRDWLRRHPDGDARGLTAEMEAWVRDVAVGFESHEERELLTRVAVLLQDAGTTPAPLDRGAPVDTAGRVALLHRLRSGARRLRATDPATLGRLRDRADRLARRLDALGIGPGELGLPLHWGRAALFVVRELEILLVGLPLALWGWLSHLPAFLLTRGLVRRLSADEDHWASNAVFVSIPVFGLWYLVLGATALALLMPIPALAYLASVPLTGAIALLYRDRTGSAWRRVRTFLTFVRRPDRQAELQAELRSLTDDIRDLEPRMAAHE